MLKIKASEFSIADLLVIFNRGSRNFDLVRFFMGKI